MAVSDMEEPNKIEQKREYLLTQPVEKPVYKMAVPTVVCTPSRGQ